VSKTHRRKRAIIPDWILARLVQSPPGASINAMHYAFDTNTLHLSISHPSFPETPEGERVPLLAPVVYETDDGELRVDWGITETEVVT
jgi:hypothetical protein